MSSKIKKTFGDHSKERVNREYADWIWSREGGRMNTKLGTFAGNNMLDDFRRALKKDADINYASKRTCGNNALLYAISSSGVDVAVWIAENSKKLHADLNAQDRFRWNVPASWHRRMGVGGTRQDSLRRYGRFLDIEDRFGWTRGPYLKNTALILAVKKGWDHVNCYPEAHACLTPMKAAIRALVENGADLDIQDACGNTALHIAVMRRDVECIKLLLRHGARTDIANNGELVAAQMLDVKYRDINPFLYVQCGNDTNCYIHTLQSHKSWIEARPAIERGFARAGTPVPADARTRHPAPV